uniref:SAM domain-containing protein n=1 Tax=Ditylum brightwellii TaxID=49249 RepID=A0A7S4VV10_9STRA
MTHAAQILQTLSLSHHAKAFHEHSIESSEDVQLLSWEDLEELGIVEIDDRYRIWSWIEHQQILSSQAKPSSCVCCLVEVNNKCTERKRGKMANAFSLRHLMTQAKSLAGSSVTIDVSIKLSDSGKRRTSRKPRRASSSIPKHIHVEDPILEFDDSSCCSQMTEDDIIETPKTNSC